MRLLRRADDPGIIGATLGLKGFRGRAEIAARQFVWATGLSAAIIGDEDIPRLAGLIVRHCPASLPFADFPFAAKLFLFDLLDSERLVYFDADLLYVNRWDPTALAADAMHVVRDIWWNPGIQSDSRHWGLPFGHYFNAGFLVLKRDLHFPLLAAAAGSIGRFPSLLREQASLNGEAFHRKLKINWMHRDYNVIDGGSTVEAGRFPVKGLHLGGRREEAAYRQVIASHEGQGGECPAAEGVSMAGKWIYARGGKQRELEFWDDGMIGRGGANCERFWRIWIENGQPTLGVFGYCNPRGRVSETFHAVFDGEAWHGRWNDFERNEVTLTSIHSGTGGQPVQGRRCMT